MSLRPIEALGSLSNSIKGSKMQSQLQHRVHMNEAMQAEAQRLADTRNRRKSQKANLDHPTRFQSKHKEQQHSGNQEKKKQPFPHAPRERDKGTFIDYST
ncbi:hypothetical protein [Alkalicoccobacillus porphyridii]|uniref:Uncharacterized protein n=1 Tax=Alkalicoccobacillus porphyridii TaxID=2597270 RepID=A0A553ZYB2_9BACI|nr:hypothetical protein [Alkalicoccobacillus porphyridii]TSB46432.1 hypothetical protein FN960_11550 [Alkalicoccobacillus porphyridii]